MYKPVLPTATGIALLPATGSNRLLFALAAGLMISGIVVMTISFILARKSARAN
jgi:hypothetical protein